jgi:hypothetical protein
MVLRVTAATVCGATELDLKFNDGSSGRVDVSPILVGVVFQALKDPTFFAKGVLDPVCGTVVWPNGADIAPEALRELLADSGRVLNGVLRS